MKMIDSRQSLPLLAAQKSTTYLVVVTSRHSRRINTRGEHTKDCACVCVCVVRVLVRSDQTTYWSMPDIFHEVFLVAELGAYGSG